jgi:23S rRNA (uracil1939-C5)-methyltransferase
VNRVLVQRVLELARDAGASTFCDLYCGSGNFTLPLVHAGLSGVGVEESASAISQARQAAEQQGLGAARFYSEEAAAFAQRAARAGERFDLVILDPPRAGVKKSLDSMAELSAGRLILVGCDPVTFARDLARLGSLGLVVRGIEAFDMFPQTHHVEALAWLDRNEN